MIDKKAVSGVIVTVLLVLLVFAAIAIVATVILPFVENNLADVQGQAACIKLGLEIESATFTPKDNSDPNNIIPVTTTIKIKRTGGDANISSINVFIDGQLKTPTNPNKAIPPEFTGEVSTYVFKEVNGKDKPVSIVPVLTDGTECQEIGPVTITKAE